VGEGIRDGSGEWSGGVGKGGEKKAGGEGEKLVCRQGLGGNVGVNGGGKGGGIQIATRIEGKLVSLKKGRGLKMALSLMCSAGGRPWG